METSSYIESYIRDNSKAYRKDMLYLYLLYMIYKESNEPKEQVLRALKTAINGSETEITYPEISAEAMRKLTDNREESVDFCIKELTVRPIGILRNFMGTPEDVAKLCVNSVQPQSGEFVYMPFSGLATEAMMLPDNVILKGEEIDELTWALGQIRLWSIGRLENGIIHADSYERFVSSADINNPDVIIMQPPYGNNTQKTAYREDLPFAVEQALQRLSDTGRMAVVMPSSFLVNIGYRELRKKLLPHISSIVELKNMVSYMSREFLLLIIQKQPSDIISLSNGEKNIVLEKSELKDSNFLPKHYLEELEIICDYPLVPIKDLIERIDLDELGDESIEKAGIGQLSQDISDYSLKRNSDHSAYWERAIKKKDRCVLRERAILVSNSVPVKVAEFSPSENSPAIAIDRRSVCAYRIRPDKRSEINHAYLIYALLGQELSQQIDHEFKTTTSSYARISSQDLLRFRIPLPPKNEQQKIVSQAIMDTLSESQRLTVKKLEESIQHQRILRHQLGSLFSLLRTKIENLDAFRKANGGVLHDTDFLSRRKMVTVADQFDGIMEVADEVGELIATMRDFSGDYATGIFNLNKFLQDLVKRYDYVNIDFAPNIDAPDVCLLFREPALRVVCGNIIDNAIRHGFGNNINPQHDMIRIRWSMEDSAAVVEISNNGKPLTINPDLVLTIGETSDRKSGDGIGGYQIYNHMRADGAEVQVVSTPEDEFTVTFRLKFNNIIIQTEEDE